MSSTTPIVQRLITAQPSQPEGRPGLLWVDTSTEERNIYLYENGSFNPIKNIYAQDTEPSDTREGVTWVDTSTENNITYVRSGEEWVPTNIQEQENLNSVLFPGLFG